MITLHNVSEEDLKLFYENLDNQVLLRRAQAIVRQREAARLIHATGGQKVVRGRCGSLTYRPMANIDPTYYFTRKAQEMEASEHRQKTDENVWSDPEFVDWELKRNPELRPVIDDRNAPVHMSGIVLPTAANFKAAKAARSDK